MVINNRFKTIFIRSTRNGSTYLNNNIPKSHFNLCDNELYNSDIDLYVENFRLTSIKDLFDKINIPIRSKILDGNKNDEDYLHPELYRLIDFFYKTDLISLNNFFSTNQQKKINFSR